MFQEKVKTCPSGAMEIYEYLFYHKKTLSPNSAPCHPNPAPNLLIFEEKTGILPNPFLNWDNFQDSSEKICSPAGTVFFYDKIMIKPRWRKNIGISQKWQLCPPSPCDNIVHLVWMCMHIFDHKKYMRISRKGPPLLRLIFIFAKKTNILPHAFLNWDIVTNCTSLPTRDILRG